MSDAQAVEVPSVADQWAAVRERARTAGLSASRIADLACVPRRTVSDMLADDWRPRTIENMRRVERAIEAAIEETKKSPAA